MRGWNRLATLGTVLCVLTLGGCRSDPTSPEEEERDTPGLAASVVTAEHGPADVYRTPAPAAGEPVGWSTLARRAHAVRLRLVTDVLPPRHAATIWAVIFNNPEACAASPCVGADLDNPDVEGSVVWAAGSITRRHGAHFRGRLTPGDDSRALRGSGLLDPLGAEIHLLVRSHGPLIPGLVHEQLSTASGGCDVFITPEIPTAEGECADVAFSIHLP